MANYRILHANSSIWALIIAIISDTVFGMDVRYDVGNSTSTRNSNVGGRRSTLHVPFFVVGTPTVDFTSLVRAMSEHRDSISASLKNLDRAYRVARASEYILFRDDDLSPLSSSLERRIERMANLLEADTLVLEALLEPFDIITALPNPSESSSAQQQCGGGHETLRGTSTFSNDNIAHTHNNLLPSINGDSATVTDNYSPSSYDSAMHAIAHIVRDWTILGREVRKSTYRWCVNELHELYEENIRSKTKVLVPGAGLARLSYDIALSGFNVDANECSLVMSAVAHKFLHGVAAGSLHPFCYDSLMNEVDSQLRYEEVIFPEDDTGPDHIMGTMSFTIGDFILSYSPAAKHQSFDSVVTCFFIDTATNIYEYIAIIHHVLRDGGTWINLGEL